MSYMEGQAFKLLVKHKWAAALGGCAGPECEWRGNHDEIEQIEHAEHVAQELSIAGLLPESRTSIATIKAQALYEVAEEVCTCGFSSEDNLFHDESCPTWILTKRADRMK